MENTIKSPEINKTVCYDPDSPLKPGLYIVATPIGNIKDITLRAIEILKQVDLIACEDTRVTKKLIAHYALKSSLTLYHEHNAAKIRPSIIRKIQNGKSIALVSDAGMPTISDPGYKLIRECIIKGMFVTVIPGATASLSALVLSGLPTDRFFFYGYLPTRKTQRRKALNGISSIQASLIFFESPARLLDSLSDMCDVFGDREASVAREITKLHEEILRGTLNDLKANFNTIGAVKGELVVVVSPSTVKSTYSDDELVEELSKRLGHKSVKDAVSEVTFISKESRRRIYGLAVGLKAKDQ